MNLVILQPLLVSEACDTLSGLYKFEICNIYIYYIWEYIVHKS